MEVDSKFQRRTPSMFGVIMVSMIFIISFDFSAARTGNNEDCVVNLGPHPNRNLPLLVSRKRGILLPSNSRSIIINNREFVQVVCPGRGNNVVGHTNATLNATCKDRGRLLEGPNSRNFTVNCTMQLTETVRETTEKCGAGNRSKIIEIGWDFPNRGFHRMIEVCFNEDLLSTEYTRHILKGSGVPYRDRDAPWLNRPNFKLDKFFSGKKPSISTVFNQEMQRETLTTLLGNRERAESYIGGWGPTSYLSKGHLSPDADFTLQTWQDSTYHFINVVPQWQAFNNGNWKVLEGAIRIQATKPSPRDLTIYTGTFGIVKLLDVNQNEVDFYLSLGQKHGVPVPKYIWKVVIDPKRNEAVAFILNNSPSNPQFPNHETTSLCPDVCNRIRWVKWKARNDETKGLMYCCSLQSVRNKIVSIPNLPGVRLMET